MLGSRRLALVSVIGLALACAALRAETKMEKRPHVRVRGIYGGVPTQIFERGSTLASYGVNAIWMGSGGLTEERIETVKRHGAKIYAEFNTMHEASYLKEHPDAAPVGTDGQVCPAPNGWQGVCPTQPGYRKNRMDAFRSTLARFAIDGIWLDYHHSHASWEQAVPEMPETCFCARCLAQFRKDTATKLPDAPTPELARLLLGEMKPKWVRWRCGVFTDWVREFREIRDAARPGALLGTFHCPWSNEDFGGARMDKLAIDLKAQAKHIDVFSIMPYHARFGHPKDPAWISRQTAWLGRHLGIEGKDGERLKIWPIVQLSDWGETVPESQVREVLDHGTRKPSTGIMIFAWGRLHESWGKVEEMGRFFREIGP